MVVWIMLIIAGALILLATALFSKLLWAKIFGFGGVVWFASPLKLGVFTTPFYIGFTGVLLILLTLWWEVKFNKNK